MLRLWDVRTRQAVGTPLAGHRSSVTSVAFSPDGSRVASGNDDQTLRLWDVKTRQPIGAALSGHKSWVTSLAFTPDGTKIASASADKTVRLWPAPKVWPDMLCAKLTRNMSHKQWREQVSPDIDYIEQCPGLPIPPEESEEQLTTRSVNDAKN
jgi:WD40 repeat protein